MLPLGDVLKFRVPSEAEKFLKPVWDTVIDYLVLGVVMVVVVTGVIGLYNPGYVCIPILRCAEQENATWSKKIACDMLRNSSELGKHSYGSATFAVTFTDRNLFDYINSQCSDHITWMVRLFPNMLIVMAIIGVICSNAWFVLKSPVLEQFSELLHECYKYGPTEDTSNCPCTSAGQCTSTGPGTLHPKETTVAIRAILETPQEPHASTNNQHAKLVVKATFDDREAVLEKLRKFKAKLQTNDHTAYNCCPCNCCGIKGSYIIVVGIQVFANGVIIGMTSCFLNKELKPEYECNIKDKLIIPGLVYDNFLCSASIYMIYRFCAITFLFLICPQTFIIIVKLVWLLTFVEIRTICNELIGHCSRQSPSSSSEDGESESTSSDLSFLLELVKLSYPAYHTTFQSMYNASQEPTQKQHENLHENQRAEPNTKTNIVFESGV